MKVFLGGTCEGFDWRKIVKERINKDYFDPVVPEWTEECRIREIQERETCDFVLFVITGDMKGIYSIAEVVDDSNKRPRKTICCFLAETFGEEKQSSIRATEKMVAANGATVCYSLDEVIRYINEQ